MKAVGIDLALVEPRPTGFCVLDEKFNAQTFLLHSDNQIIEMIEQISPDVVSIDAPLALPKDRSTFLQDTGIGLICENAIKCFSKWAYGSFQSRLDPYEN